MYTTECRQRGFTLIELVIFIVVVSIGIAGILTVMDTVVKSSADPMARKQTMAIAEALLDEILLKNYANPSGGYAGSDRSLFDDVSDYHGYSTSSGVLDLAGTAIAGLGSYNINSVVVAATTELTGVAAAKKVTVTVSGPAGSLSLSGYRTNY